MAPSTWHLSFGLFSKRPAFRTRRAALLLFGTRQGLPVSARGFFGPRNSASAAPQSRPCASSPCCWWPQIWKKCSFAWPLFLSKEKMVHFACSLSSKEKELIHTHKIKTQDLLFKRLHPNMCCLAMQKKIIIPQWSFTKKNEKSNSCAPSGTGGAAGRMTRALANRRGALAAPSTQGPSRTNLTESCCHHFMNHPHWNHCVTGLTTKKNSLPLYLFQLHKSTASLLAKPTGAYLAPAFGRSSAFGLFARQTSAWPSSDCSWTSGRCTPKPPVLGGWTGGMGRSLGRKRLFVEKNPGSVGSMKGCCLFWLVVW